MTLTRDFKQTVIERVERDPAFAKALLDEAATLFLSGEPDAARLILRDLVNATVGFETLAELTQKPSKSLHRMLVLTRFHGHMRALGFRPEWGGVWGDYRQCMPAQRVRSSR